MSFPARREGICTECHRLVTKGERIVWDKPTRRIWHDTCWQAWLALQKADAEPVNKHTWLGAVPHTPTGLNRKQHIRGLRAYR